MALFDQKPENNVAKMWISYGGEKPLKVEMRRLFNAGANKFLWDIQLDDKIAVTNPEFPEEQLKAALPMVGIVGLSNHVVRTIRAWFDDQAPRMQKFMEEKKDG